MAKMSITLQVWGNNHAKTTSIQGEAGSRTIEVTFLDASGAPVDLTGCTPRMAVDNGTSEPLMNDGTIVDAAGGTADFTITSDMLTRPGDWPCEFALTGLNYPLLKANGMMLHIDASNTENAVGSTNQLASLWTALNKADAAAATAQNAAADAQKADKKANDAVAEADRAKATSDAAAQKATEAADTAEKAAQDALNSHSMLSPVTHCVEAITKVINDVYASIAALGSGTPTAAEYTAYGLTAEQYATKMITAAQYAVAGKSLLGG